MATRSGKGIKASQRATRGMSEVQNDGGSSLSSGGLDRAQFGAGSGEVTGAIQASSDASSAGFSSMSGQLSGVNHSLNDLNDNMQVLKKLETATLLFEFSKFKDFGNTFDKMEGTFGGQEKVATDHKKQNDANFDELITRTEAGNRSIVEAITRLHGMIGGDSAKQFHDRKKNVSASQNDNLDRGRHVRDAQRAILDKHGISKIDYTQPMSEAMAKANKEFLEAGKQASVNHKMQSKIDTPMLNKDFGSGAGSKESIDLLTKIELNTRIFRQFLNKEKYAGTADREQKLEEKRNRENQLRLGYTKGESSADVIKETKALATVTNTYNSSGGSMLEGAIGATLLGNLKKFGLALVALAPALRVISVGFGVLAALLPNNNIASQELEDQMLDEQKGNPSPFAPLTPDQEANLAKLKAAEALKMKKAQDAKNAKMKKARDALVLTPDKQKLMDNLTKQNNPDHLSGLAPKKLSEMSIEEIKALQDQHKKNKPKGGLKIRWKHTGKALRQALHAAELRKRRKDDPEGAERDRLKLESFVNGAEQRYNDHQQLQLQQSQVERDAAKGGDGANNAPVIINQGATTSNSGNSQHITNNNYAPDINAQLNGMVPATGVTPGLQ